MLRLFLDAAVLMAVLHAILQNDAPDFVHLVLVSLGMAVANFACYVLLVSSIGLLVIAPILIIDGLILMYFCALTIKQAAITLGVLLVYQVTLYALLT
jgi:hypothetical protein